MYLYIRLAIILKRMHVNKLIRTNLKKRSLKKLLLDACTKTSFIFNNKFYEQKDVVRTGSPLGPLLVNIIIAELEDNVINEFVDDGTIKFYERFVDDTSEVIKLKDIGCVDQTLNNFHCRLIWKCFTPFL